MLAQDRTPLVKEGGRGKPGENSGRSHTPAPGASCRARLLLRRGLPASDLGAPGLGAGSGGGWQERKVLGGVCGALTCTFPDTCALFLGLSGGSSHPHINNTLKLSVDI